ncbi:MULTISPECIES: NAD-dependent epimerase/dehydratase family protein [Burkholderia]|jgi:nucleoside-diphosphate-sugar epimerase|uniref:NAD-dependent epimerase/dehydratase family protein n=2 Tax=Burkholderia contaminans TaxID=488447 RepID=A0A250L1I3_9BURK|nr:MULTISPECIES: NAD-dependent epimerase/dehydratase family protein [Burkholderia]UTP26040.1 NAD-dependent epimerase/dehydratase family protein [Burkholderia sp. FXe9]KKL29309.1 membrane protein [Burkholderia contaminans LMG 23361]MBA9828784.1 NAD-dependent epimerase/dehydratase family protein [Burkholderia contaminans]MBA9838449.1 NAD-dependent epimerase/dehydratase family protein [Burkholderia contaminans]MBA9863058.1 NAD-dependent epimerase/dehydratase family protein [Burkholderia contamina
MTTHAGGTQRQALVLGASGGIGGEVARQLRDAGWLVRGLKRGLDAEVAERDGITWIRGDAMDRDAVVRAARGCSVIVHAVNPPGYRNWAGQVLPMIDNTIAAAKAERATIVLPGTVYNYGPDAFPVLVEDAPQHPSTRKGAIRVELERRLQDAAGQGVRTIIVRAGDFFGPKLTGNSWFAAGFVKAGQPVASISVPGRAGIGHQWSYVPDAARAMVELIERRDTLEPFARFHLGGHWDADGTQMAEAVRRIAQRHGLRPTVRKFPWWFVWAAAPFVTTLRELLEMRYLWREPVRLDNTRVTAVLGREPVTPLDTAVEATLAGLGCLK